MNPIAIVGVGAAAISVVGSYVKVSREERAKRAQIRKNTQAQIAAIHYAKEKVMDEINNAEQVPAIDTLMTDFEFHKTVYHLTH